MRNPITALLYPIQTWRAFAQRVDDAADAVAVAAGLTVEHLPGGVRRYRDPRLDQLGRRRTQHVIPAAAWSTPNLTVSGARLAMTEAPAGPAAPANGMPVRLRRAAPSAGAGAVPSLTVPPPGRSASSASLRDHLAVALDPGHPAAAVTGAPTGSREEHAPARPGTGPRSSR